MGQGDSGVTPEGVSLEFKSTISMALSGLRVVLTWVRSARPPPGSVLSYVFDAMLGHDDSFLIG